jgi:hypothetical protein
MAAISRTPHLDRAINTATILTRTAVAVGVPLYLYLNLDFIPTLHSPPAKLIAGSVAMLSAPSTLYCALGALEGVVRSCIQYFNYHTGTNPDFQWDQFSKEVKTTRGLLEASISPLAGYTFMHHEWNKLGTEKDKPRVLKEAYVVYSFPRAVGKQLVKAGKWCLRKLKLEFDRFVARTTNTIQTAWRGVCWIADTTVSIAKCGWRVSAPLRELLWNITIAVKNWSLDRLLDLWRISQPIRNGIKVILWDVLAVQLIWTFMVKTVIWNFVIKTVIVDVIVTKIFINLICEIIIGKIIWPPVKFVGKEILWPIIKFTFNLVGTIIGMAFAAISWAVSQAFRRGRK